MLTTSHRIATLNSRRIAARTSAGRRTASQHNATFLKNRMRIALANYPASALTANRAITEPETQQKPDGTGSALGANIFTMMKSERLHSADDIQELSV